MTLDHEPSPQKLIEFLRERRKEVGKKMENTPLSGDQEGFPELFVVAELLDSAIKEILDSIKPESPGPISQSSIRTSRSPDERIITRKR